MKLINQLDYSATLYPTSLVQGIPAAPPYPTIARAGCGICCICMLVELLCGRALSVEEGIALSIEARANCFGTDMKRLGALVAERYQLNMRLTDEIGAVRSCLSSGGAAIFNVGGSTIHRKGTFSDGGHFVLAQAGPSGTLRVWDPSFSREKYQTEQRAERVQICQDRSLLTELETIREDLAMRSPGAYLFWRGGTKEPQHNS